MTNGAKIFITALGIIVLLALRQSVAEPRIIVQVPTPRQAPERGPSIAEVSHCDLVEKTGEAFTMLSTATPKVGTKQYYWREDRNGNVEPRLSVEREIAMVLLRLDTCENNQITVSVQGDKIVAPDGYDIRPVRRDNGILMNRWNTEFKARCPGMDGKPVDCVVLANVEPDNKSIVTNRSIYTASGLWTTVPTQVRGTEFRTYAPYSRDVHSYELVQAGKEYLQELFEGACAALSEKHVRGEAYQNREICDYPSFTEEMFERLVLVEGAGMGEFIVEDERTMERVYVIFGMNGKRAYVYTCSEADACGALQFIPATYQHIRDKYGPADLIEDFTEGTRSHLNIAQAAILLHADNLAIFKRYLTTEQYEELLADPRLLEEALAASYNTGATRTVNVLRAHFQRTDRSDVEWADAVAGGKYGNLLPETLGYIAKLRFLFDWDGPEPKIGRN